MTTPGKSHGFPTIALALLVAFLLTAGLITIIAAIIPGILLMVIAGFGLILTFVAQYFLWARWLYPIVLKMEQPPEPVLQPEVTEPSTSRL